LSLTINRIYIFNKVDFNYYIDTLIYFVILL